METEDPWKGDIVRGVTSVRIRVDPRNPCNAQIVLQNARDTRVIGVRLDRSTKPAEPFPELGQAGEEPAKATRDALRMLLALGTQQHIALANKPDATPNELDSFASITQKELSALCGVSSNYFSRALRLKEGVESEIVQFVPRKDDTKNQQPQRLRLRDGIKFAASPECDEVSIDAIKNWPGSNQEIERNANQVTDVRIVAQTRALQVVPTGLWVGTLGIITVSAYLLWSRASVHSSVNELNVLPVRPPEGTSSVSPKEASYSDQGVTSNKPSSFDQSDTNEVTVILEPGVLGGVVSDAIAVRDIQKELRYWRDRVADRLKPRCTRCLDHLPEVRVRTEAQVSDTTQHDPKELLAVTGQLEFRRLPDGRGNYYFNYAHGFIGLKALSRLSSPPPGMQLSLHLPRQPEFTVSEDGHGYASNCLQPIVELRPRILEAILRSPNTAKPAGAGAQGLEKLYFRRHTPTYGAQTVNGFPVFDLACSLNSEFSQFTGLDDWRRTLTVFRVDELATRSLRQLVESLLELRVALDALLTKALPGSTSLDGHLFRRLFGAESAWLVESERVPELDALPALIRADILLASLGSGESQISPVSPAKTSGLIVNLLRAYQLSPKIRAVQQARTYSRLQAARLEYYRGHILRALTIIDDAVNDASGEDKAELALLASRFASATRIGANRSARVLTDIPRYLDIVESIGWRAIADFERGRYCAFAREQECPGGKDHNFYLNRILGEDGRPRHILTRFLKILLPHNGVGPNNGPSEDDIRAARDLTEDMLTNWNVYNAELHSLGRGDNVYFSVETTASLALLITVSLAACECDLALETIRAADALPRVDWSLLAKYAEKGPVSFSVTMCPYPNFSTWSIPEDESCAAVRQHCRDTLVAEIHAAEYLRADRQKVFAWPRFETDVCL